LIEYSDFYGYCRVFLTFKYLLLTCVLVLGLLMPGCGQQPKKTTTDIPSRIAAVEKGLFKKGETTTWTLSERMAFYKIKGVSIAVISHYQVEWVKAYGWANEDAKTPVTPQTLFQAASISKSLNAVGVLKLVQARRLDLNTDINQYLKSWKFPYDSVAKNKKITLNELLSHTAGLSVHGFAGYQRGMPVPTIVQILDGLPPANSAPIRSMFEPGLRSEYSGGGSPFHSLSWRM
jgi:CubicO group peptidase (beta-lactamase class C family)